ncbi:DUF2158 domain-containing protein [Caballeronia sp. LZ033]|uniref:YodC family protein n=1 Tax=Caballeronia sp. LZ033 TaxID=3038566 RepID=UPI0028576E0C|nr:DUF2158 domain-containing protein [Caballeronia sp. LZ033]MDR5815807.1 DUF2158 domain-containing protein [Caballeronia sp. LZ033]
MSEVKKGDVVELKSGGPRMTVAEVDDYSPMGPLRGAKCVWFEKNAQKEHVFDVDVLKVVNDTDPSSPLAMRRG